MSTSSSSSIFPLISTTASLSYAIFEILVFRGLVTASSASPTDHAAVARTISAWWKTTYFQGLSLIVITGACSLANGIMAIRSYVPRSSQWWLAVAGTGFAVGHFALAPAVVPVIDAMAAVYDAESTKKEGKGSVVMSETEKDEKSVELQRKWNQVHLIRSLVVDLPAMLCFAALALWEK